ncbi:uncharacterized protein LOC128235033 isoform X2 [Mya arenaria]|uniref:uncharacterized protein LOC128234812 isoform X2 n=1 Tax=Mya arenaria TaxID=6604 RepID=UPI0022E4E483|nr:uncharacterized protein LOC128234812 isoform X2 [Mya arenaria]XP_052805685.1 uncharacterized protein LOC128235033 isoform X2 [Mya arenaria]
MGRPRRKLKLTKKAQESGEEGLLKIKMQPHRKRGIRMKLKKVPKQEPDDEDIDEGTSSPAEDDQDEEVVPRSSYRSPMTPGKPRKAYVTYSHEDLLNAVRCIKEEGMSVYKAAELYGVPKSTLHDKACGKSNMLFQRKGPSPLLSYDDEKKLVDYLLQMSNLGYMFSIQELRNLASELAVEKGKLCEGMLLSPRWHKSFRTRWPILNEKVFGDFRTCERKHRDEPRRKTLETFEFEEDGEQIQISTMADEMDICLSNYFTELRVILEKYDLMDRPGRIYCIDEVAIQYESGHPKARQIKSLKTSFPSRSETTVVSLIGCGNALGNSLPPFLIYPGFKLDSDLMKGKYPGVQGVCTENGLTDYSTMKHYLEKHFIEHAMLGMRSRTPPVLVLYDGSKSKVSPDTISWAKSHNIILFVLPPNSVNLKHPLEKGCFRQFKDHFIRETRIFREMYNVDFISRKAICKIVSEAYPVAMSCKNLVEMFGDIGIFPYKPSIVLCDELRTERFDRKTRYHSIKKRPPGMKDKGVQIWIKDDSQLKLIKSGRRRIIVQEDPNVDDVDSTATFLRDKKIQKMLEGNAGLRAKHGGESDYSDTDDFDDEEEQMVEMEMEDHNMNGVGVRRTFAQPAQSTDGTEYVTESMVTEENTFKMDNSHAYALPGNSVESNNSGTQTPGQGETEPDPMEQTRVAVQALQDIANDYQYVTASSLPMNTTVQNVTLNSGRMIQVVVQAPADQVIESEQIIESVEQIEIDNSVDSIIPMSVATEIVESGETIVQNS